MDDVQLANWYAGLDVGPVGVCRLFEHSLLAALKVPSGSTVWLSDYTLTKIAFSHKEIDFRDYQRLPEIISAGFVVPGNKQRTIEVDHADLGGPRYRFWRACLKATAQHNDVYITMFHRSHLKDMRRLYRRAHKKGFLLRDHKDTPARLREGGAPEVPPLRSALDERATAGSLTVSLTHL